MEELSWITAGTVSKVHTNSIENAWAVFKRSVTGTWHHVSNKHLGRYVNEAAFCRWGPQQFVAYSRVASLPEQQTVTRLDSYSSISWGYCSCCDVDHPLSGAF